MIIEAFLAEGKITKKIFPPTEETVDANHPLPYPYPEESSNYRDAVENRLHKLLLRSLEMDAYAT